MEGTYVLPYPGDRDSLLPPMLIWPGLNVLKRLLLIWAPLALGSVAFLARDLSRGAEASWSMCVVWGLIVVLTGPFGLVAYVLAYRRRHRAPARAQGT